MHIALPKTRTAEKLPSSERRLGFLAAGRDAALGYVGGYLLTTARGRPLEFHYTSPVKPSPTHRILYGSELEPYIYEELIAGSLLQQSAIEPAYVITDQPLVLGARPRLSCPLLCWSAGPSVPADVAAAPAGPSELCTLPDRTQGTVARSASDGANDGDLRTHPEFSQDREALCQWLSETNPRLDLGEPFARIWSAVREVLSAEPIRDAA